MKTVNIFSYSELSEEAKEFAYQEWLKKDREFFYESEYINTLVKGLEHFDFRLKNYSFDYFCASNGYFRIESYLDQEVLELTGNELKDYIIENYSERRSIFRHYDFVNIFSGNCELTGACYDEDFLQPVKDFLESPTNDNLYDLMKECINSLMKALESDYEGCQTKEYFEDEAIFNDYEYFENGEEY